MRLTKKECKQIYDKFFENFNTRGYKTLEFLRKEIDGGFMIFHIGQWKEEKENGLAGYDLLLVDENNNVFYDESDGEIKLGLIKKYFDIIENVNDVMSNSTSINYRKFEILEKWNEMRSSC